MAGIHISEIDYGKHASMVLTDTLEHRIDAYAWLSQFTSLPTLLAGLASGLEQGINRDLSADLLQKQRKEWAEGFKERFPSLNETSVLFKKDEPKDEPEP